MGEADPPEDDRLREPVAEGEAPIERLAGEIAAFETPLGSLEIAVAAHGR